MLEVSFSYDAASDEWIIRDAWDSSRVFARGRTIQEVAAKFADEERRRLPRDIAESALQGGA